MKYRWDIAPTQPVLTSVLAPELKISPLLAQCLLNRGFSEPESISRFLQPRLKHLADPFLIPNMREAVERLFQARAGGERLVLFGDYDVDGVTSVTLLAEVLRHFGWTVDCYLPHRIEEGYGLSQTAVAKCLDRFPVSLLVAVDCGSTSRETIGWLQARGVDTIVLDHHQLASASSLPPARALVNPQLGRSDAPSFRELCSVGLTFKLTHAIVKHGRSHGLPGALEYDLRPCLDLVALGTVADLVPLSGENRILVQAGLERLGTSQRPGLIALKRVAAVGRRLSAHQVAFQLAPRLNAAGRLETATAAWHLLETKDEQEANRLASQLDAWNRERQQLEKNITEQALAAVRERSGGQPDAVIVEGNSEWHLGVVGIVASRLLQQYYRPTIVLGSDGSHGADYRGSGRSIEGFDLAAALRQCDDLLVRHGGHAMAAGLTVRAVQVEGLRTRLNDLARRTLKPEWLQPALRIDAVVGIEEVNLDRVRELSQLEHTGMGNPPVHLVLRGVTHARPLQRLGAEKKHAKLWITDGRQVLEALLWSVGDGPLPVGRFDLACTPQINEYEGTRSVQLKVLDWAEVGC